MRIFRYQRGFLHQKVMLIDERLAAVGTANLDNRSFRLNFEITAFSTDREFVGRGEGTCCKRISAMRREAKVEDFTRQAVPVPRRLPRGAPVRADPVSAAPGWLTLPTGFPSRLAWR